MKSRRYFEMTEKEVDTFKNLCNITQWCVKEDFKGRNKNHMKNKDPSIYSKKWGQQSKLKEDKRMKIIMRAEIN